MRPATKSRGSPMDEASDAPPGEDEPSGSEFDPDDEGNEEEELADDAMDVDEEEQPRKRNGRKPQLQRADIEAARAHTEALSGGVRPASARKRKGSPAVADTPERTSYVFPM